MHIKLLRNSIYAYKIIKKFNMQNAEVMLNVQKHTTYAILTMGFVQGTTLQREVLLSLQLVRSLLLILQVEHPFHFLSISVNNATTNQQNQAMKKDKLSVKVLPVLANERRC